MAPSLTVPPVLAARAEQQQLGFLFGAKDAVRGLVQQRAELGQHHAPAASMEQLHPEALLQAGDVSRDRGLAQAEQAGRA